MYYINTATDKPDARERKATLEILMRRGIRVDNVQKAYDYFTKTLFFIVLPNLCTIIISSIKKLLFHLKHNHPEPLTCPRTLPFYHIHLKTQFLYNFTF